MVAERHKLFLPTYCADLACAIDKCGATKAT